MVMRACVAVGTLLSLRLKCRSLSEPRLLRWGLQESRDPSWELTWREWGGGGALAETPSSRLQGT